MCLQKNTVLLFELLPTYAISMMKARIFVGNKFHGILLNKLGLYEIQNIHLVHYILCHMECLIRENRAFLLVPRGGCAS